MFRIRLWALCACSTSVIAGAAFAQSTADVADDSGDIIVTAQKRSERLNDVPLSITAATGEQLARQGINGPEDLSKIVPGFTYQKSSYGVPVFTIRGVGFYENSLAVAPTVSVYVDQVPVPYSAMTAGAALDVERIEALKGPQGTLFGQNSTGGAINYIANKPTPELRFGGDLTYGRFNQFDAQGYVSGPMSENIRARLAVRSEQRGSWQKSYTRDDKLGKRDFLTGRLLLDWDVSDRVKVELNLSGWRDKSETQANQFLLYAPNVVPGRDEQAAILPTYPVAPSNPRAADWDAGFDLTRNDRFYQASLRADIEMSDSVTLTSISAYSDFRAHTPSDTDGVNFNDFRVTINADVNSFSQEVRLAGTLSDERLRWMVGGNYQHDKAFDDHFGEAMGSNDQVGPFKFNTFINSNHQIIDTWAAFGSLDYKLTDTFTLQGSARYTKQDRDFAGCLYDSGDGQLAAPFTFLSNLLTGGSITLPPGACVTFDNDTNIPLPIVRDQLNEDNLSWRVSLNWKPSNDLMLYANVTRGYKAGGFPTNAAIKVATYTPVRQESLLAYEAGFKATVLDRTMQLTGAVFYYDYTDKQILGDIDTGFPFGKLPALVTIPASSVRGAEFNVFWAPVHGLKFNVGGTYVDSKVDKSFPTTDPFNRPIDIKGEHFPNTPKWQIVGDAQYDFPLAGSLNGFVGGNISYRSSSFAAFGEAPLYALESYTLVDLRAGVESADGRWRAQVWGRNITNEYYGIHVSHVIDTVNRTAGMPATYGFTVGFRY